MSRVADYDAIAASYDRRFASFTYRGVEEALFAFVRSEGTVDVLEAGCGTGHWLDRLAQRRVSLTGLDLSAGMLRQARRKLPAARLVRGRAEELPWKAGVFDRIVCIHALHHFSDRDRFITEARRVLRPRGALMVAGLDPHVRPLRWWIYDYFPEARQIDQARYSAVAEIRAAMGQAGFATCETTLAEHVRANVSVGEAATRGLLDKTSGSQLAVLSEDEYRAGRERLLEAERSAAARGETLTLAVDLGLYSTVGRLD